MTKRVGFVGIVVNERKTSAAMVNQILSEHGDLIVGRMGVPHPSRRCSVIALIVDGTTDDIGRLTGQLGIVGGVQVRSAMSKE